MTEITAAQVKELRQETGVGMMDCKKALLETGGELDDAVDWLRKNGLAAAARKVGRVAADCLIGLSGQARPGPLPRAGAASRCAARTRPASLRGRGRCEARRPLPAVGCAFCAPFERVGRVNGAQDAHPTLAAATKRVVFAGDRNVWVLSRVALK